MSNGLDGSKGVLQETFARRDAVFYSDMASKFYGSVDRWCQYGEKHTKTRKAARNILKALPHWKIDMMNEDLGEGSINEAMELNELKNRLTLLSNCVIDAIASIQSEGGLDVAAYREHYLAIELDKHEDDYLKDLLLRQQQTYGHHLGDKVKSAYEKLNLETK